MREERLIEITSTIVKLDGLLKIVAYISSLSDSECQMFCKYVLTSKYRDLNFLAAVLSFSYNYLKCKGILSNEYLKNYDFLENDDNRYVMNFDEVMFSNMRSHRNK